MTRKSPVIHMDLRLVGLEVDYPKTELTLSAVGEVEQEHARSVAELDAMLAELRAAADANEHNAAVDRLIDAVWGAFAPPESELRAMWGDR